MGTPSIKRYVVNTDRCAVVRDIARELMFVADQREREAVNSARAATKLRAEAATLKTIAEIIRQVNVSSIQR